MMENIKYGTGFKPVPLAEGVRFELTVDCSITSFQDWLLKPLGQPSVCANDIILHRKSQGLKSNAESDRRPVPVRAAGCQ